jgi:putative hydrolase of the HAD superfamily
VKQPGFISFDLDGTLVDYDFANAVWLEGIPRFYAEKNGVSIDIAKVRIEREYDKVGMERLEWYDIKYWLNKFRLSPDIWTTLLREYKHLIKTYPETCEVLQSLKRTNYKLIVVSNAAREFLNAELNRTNIAGFFSHIFSATTDFHQVKKTESLYNKILNILEVLPAEVIHIGDNWNFDYLTPRKTGIKSFFLDRGNQKSGKYIVKNLTEFLSKI